MLYKMLNILQIISKMRFYVLARRVREAIREEIGDSKFCIIVDEAWDESKREQMAIVLRFVDKYSFIQVHFVDLVHVKDTSPLTLKNEIYVALLSILSWYSKFFHTRYDGASNMRGEWKWL